MHKTQIFPILDELPRVCMMCKLRTVCGALQTICSWTSVFSSSPRLFLCSNNCRSPNACSAVVPTAISGCCTLKFRNMFTGTIRMLHFLAHVLVQVWLWHLKVGCSLLMSNAHKKATAMLLSKIS